MGKIIPKIIQTIVSVGIGFITGGPLGAALAFAGSAIGFVLGALAPKPKKPKFDNGNLADRQQVVRQSVAPRDLVYGTAVKSGVLAYAESTGTTNEFLHLIIVLAGHRLRAILDIWFNDEIIGTTDASGNVTSGRFSTWARVKTHLGADDQAADTDLVAESTGGKWTTAHRLRGRPYLYPRLKWDQTTYQNGIPNPKAKVLGWDTIKDPRDGANRWTDNWALVIRDYLTRAQRDGGWGEPESSLDDDDFIAAANISDEMVPVVEKTYDVTASVSEDEFTLTDTNAYIWTGDGVQLSVGGGGTIPSGFSAGVTYFWVESGQHKGFLASTLTNARNRIVLNVLSAGSAVKVTRVSHPRYTLNGVVSMDESKMDVLEAMVQAGGGWIAKCQGKWRIWAGAEAEPEHELDGSWLRDGEIGLLARPSRQDLFNTVRGTYIDPARFWKENPFPNVTSDRYKDEDGGDEIAQDFQFSWQINGERAQRVAAILLNRHRLADTLTLPCNWKAFPVRLGNAVSVTLPIFGYEDATFRVMNWKFAEGFAGVDLVLQRDDPSSYAWSAGQAQTYAAAPPVTLFQPWSVPPPTDLVVTDDPLIATGGATVPRLKADWTAAADSFVVAYEVEYKLHADSVWIDGGGVVSPPAWVTPVTIGQSYDVRVTAVRGNGAKSDPSAAVVSNHTAGGDTTAPDAPTGFSATARTGAIELNWTNATQNDLYVVDVYRNTSNNSATALKVSEITSIGQTPATPGNWTDTVTTGQTRYYWLKSRDSSGNASAFSSVASATAS